MRKARYLKHLEIESQIQSRYPQEMPNAETMNYWTMIGRQIKELDAMHGYGRLREQQILQSHNLEDEDEDHCVSEHSGDSGERSNHSYMADSEESTSTMEDEDVREQDLWDGSYDSMKEDYRDQENYEREEFKEDQEMSYLELNKDEKEKEH